MAGKIRIELDPDKVANGIAAVIKEEIEGATAPLVARISALEEQLGILAQRMTDLEESTHG